MRIEGSVRSNLLSAIASARRWQGASVHRDTIAYWHRLLEHGRHSSTQAQGEPVAELIAVLEAELLKREGRPSTRVNRAPTPRAI